MAKVTVPAKDLETFGVDDLGSYLRLYERSLRAANRADATIYKYLLSANPTPMAHFQIAVTSSGRTGPRRRQVRVHHCRGNDPQPLPASLT